jgi:hypothetical protein
MARYWAIMGVCLSAKLPFFAELEPRVKRGKRVLIGGAWDRADPLREQRFVELAKGRIRFASLTCAEAAASLWADVASHGLRRQGPGAASQRNAGHRDGAGRHRSPGGGAD